MILIFLFIAYQIITEWLVIEQTLEIFDKKILDSQKEAQAQFLGNRLDSVLSKYQNNHPVV